MKIKLKKEKRTHYYVLVCAHEGEYDDQTLEDTVGRAMAMVAMRAGKRDNEWWFDYFPQALKAFRKLTRFKHLTSITLRYQRKTI